jgi:hypothetical protein
MLMGSAIAWERAALPSAECRAVATMDSLYAIVRIVGESTRLREALPLKTELFMSYSLIPLPESMGPVPHGTGPIL